MSIDNYCLPIPCKSYIVKYYSSIYGSPIDLNQREDFADIILTKILTEPPKRLSKQALNIAIKGLNDQIKFRIPIDLFYRIDNSISEQKIWSINRFLERNFEQEMITIISVAGVFGVEKRTVIEAFARKYGIILEEDITLDALKKKDHRIRNNTQFKNKFLALLSSHQEFNLRA